MEIELTGLALRRKLEIHGKNLTIRVFWNGTDFEIQVVSIRYPNGGPWSGYVGGSTQIFLNRGYPIILEELVSFELYSTFVLDDRGATGAEAVWNAALELQYLLQRAIPRVTAFLQEQRDMLVLE